MTIVIILIVLAAFFALSCWVYFTTPQPKDPQDDVAKLESGKR